MNMETEFKASKASEASPAPVLFYQEGACSLGALISLLWLGDPFSLVRLEGADNENEDFLTLNALGQVPTLFLDGTILTENMAVLNYIAHRGLEKNLGFRAGTAKGDQFNRALGFLSSDFHKSFYPIFNAEKLSADKNVQAEIKKNQIEGQLRKMFQHANDHLLRTTFMFETPMPIDAYLFATSRWANDFFAVEKEFPHIHRFQQAMKKDPTVKMALEIESGKLTEAQGAFLGHKLFKTFVKEAAARKLEIDEKSGDGEFTPGLKTEPTSSPANHAGQSGAI